MPEIANKSLILASSYSQYIIFIRSLGHSPMNHRYASGQVANHLSMDRNLNVIVLPGYELNDSYTLKFMEFIYHRFYNIHYITEEELRPILDGQ